MALTGSAFANPVETALTISKGTLCVAMLLATLDLFADEAVGIAAR